MNGIIHNCTHKDSDSPTTRVTEEKMFIDIFNYIEHLFGKIKPKKLFFMAIDVRLAPSKWGGILTGLGCCAPREDEPAACQEISDGLG